MSKKKFEDMSKVEQPIAIAKEVIRRIHTGAIKPQAGVYLQPLTGESLAKPGEPCRGCALGALFVAKSYLSGDEWDLGDFYVFSDRLLSSEFSEAQRQLIENTFEGIGNHQWRDELPDDEDRMIAMMQNLVEHDGTFKPGVMYEVT